MSKSVERRKSVQWKAKAEELEAQLAARDELLESQLEKWLSLPAGVDYEADPYDTSPDDMEAHIAGLAVKEIEEALFSAPAVGRLVAKATVDGHYQHAPSLDCSWLLLYSQTPIGHLRIAVPHEEAKDSRAARFNVVVREEIEDANSKPVHSQAH